MDGGLEVQENTPKHPCARWDHRALSGCTVMHTDHRAGGKCRCTRHTDHRALSGGKDSGEWRSGRGKTDIQTPQCTFGGVHEGAQEDTGDLKDRAVRNCLPWACTQELELRNSRVETQRDAGLVSSAQLQCITWQILGGL